MIYLDNAATTFLNTNIDINKTLYLCSGNPSSLHELGRLSEIQINKTRDILSQYFYVKPKNVIFTSGGTESNNLALIGSALKLKKKGNHIISTVYEHKSNLETLKYLETLGFEITLLSPDENGEITSTALSNAITENTILISIIHVNSDVGYINDIEKLASIAKSYDKNIIFHSDCVQSFLKLNLQNLENIDLISISAHKVNGLKGTGALIKKDTIQLLPIIHGSNQEFGLRAGTENVLGISIFGQTTELLINNIKERYIQTQKINNILKNYLLSNKKIIINSTDNSSPYILNASFLGIKSEVLLHSLSNVGIMVSSGSACSSHSKIKNNTLFVMNKSNNIIDSSIRFSFMNNEENEILYTIEKLKELIPILDIGGLKR